jgi:cytochrome c peroxidase
MMKSQILSVLFVSSSFSVTWADAVSDSYLAMFKALPSEAPAAGNPSHEAKVNLGRMLYYETRLSKGGAMSCNACHPLDRYGQDNRPLSPGHDGQLGVRNSPSTYHAALHLAQFWDGRAATLEEQAKGPVLNATEMGMPSADFVVAVLKSIPGYVEAFRQAFPGEDEPIHYENFGKAIGAFERGLLTPSRWDKFLSGDPTALHEEEKRGYETFLKTGCATCHNGVAVGGMMYQKLGLVKPWPELKDAGRFEATKQEVDRFYFKVPSLRNVTETAPYLHDGSVKTLEEMVQKMAAHQLGKALSAEETTSIITFLKALKGDIPQDYVAKPQLPESGPKTPKA